jgi:methylenetetrahydrofolate reductase (NADPH)
MVRSGPVGAALLARARFEVIPTSRVEEAVVTELPRGTTVTVTASPTKGLEATVELAERLAGHGYRVVPHLAARSIVDEVQLKEVVARLKDCGVDDVFVPAGDSDPPVGRYESALEVLVALEEMGRPFADVGITGYPETHPRISDDVTIQSMWDKRRHATYIVSNLCFDARVIRRWIARVRARGVTLPLYVGVAGPVDRTRLLDVATKIGVGESARFLTRHAEWFLRLGAPGGYDPNRLLRRLEGAFADPASRVAGLHVFTFNQLRRTEEWRRSLVGAKDAAETS